MDDSNKTRVKQFYTAFQASRTDLSSRLEALKASGTPNTEALSALAVDVAKLRKELVDATSILPSYDQRQYEQFLKEIEASLEQLRASSAPKPKFAFKRKTPKVVPTSSTSSATGAVDPKPLVSPEIKDTSSHPLLSGHSHQYLDRTSLPSLESSSDLTISDLHHCIVNLLPSASSSTASLAYKFNALHVRNLTDTVLILPAIDGSALLHDLKHCTIALGCHQFRMHTSHNADVFLSIDSTPIIEHCTAIRFTAYPSALLGSVATELISQNTSKHLAVQDFSHIRATPSPNWSELPPEQVLSLEDWSRAARGGQAGTTPVDPDTLLRLLPLKKE